MKGASMRRLLATLALTSFVAPAAVNATNGLDKQFGSGGVVLLGPTPVSGLKISRITSLVIEDVGKIVIGSRFYDTANGAWLAAIGRLNADGSWDTSFGDHGLFVLPYGAASAPNGGEIHEVAVLSDHSVLAAGGASAGSGSYYSCTLLIKVDSTGALSTTFAPDHSGSFCYDFAPSGFYFFQHYDGIAVDASDAFYLTSPTTNLDHGAVAHFDSNGALITSYGNNGVADLPVGTSANLLQLVSNEVLAIGGANSGSQIAVVRLDATGNAVPTYGTAGVFAFEPQPSSCCVGPIQATLDPQHRLLIADNDYDVGTSTKLPYHLARLTDSGALDVTFNSNGQQSGYPGFAIPTVSSNANDDYLVAVQALSDGHLFAIGNAGYITAGDGIPYLALLRLNDDSSYDIAFGDAAHLGWTSINVLGTAASTTYADALAVDTSGRAFVTFSALDGLGHACSGVMRVIADRLFNGQFDPPVAFPTCP